MYSGKKTGIQFALQNKLLIDNYELGQVYRDGNRRLARATELLAHEEPGLRILEVGAGTDVTVVLGDVAKLADVQASVDSASRPVKGVVQGPLTLNDGLFESMSLAKFPAPVAARVTGTQNLPTVLLNKGGSSSS